MGGNILLLITDDAVENFLFCFESETGFLSLLRDVVIDSGIDSTGFGLNCKPYGLFVGGWPGCCGCCS